MLRIDDGTHTDTMGHALGKTCQNVWFLVYNSICIIIIINAYLPRSSVAVFRPIQHSRMRSDRHSRQVGRSCILLWSRELGRSVVRVGTVAVIYLNANIISVFLGERVKIVASSGQTTYDIPTARILLRVLQVPLVARTLPSNGSTFVGNVGSSNIVRFYVVELHLVLLAEERSVIAAQFVVIVVMIVVVNADSLIRTVEHIERCSSHKLAGMVFHDESETVRAEISEVLIERNRCPFATCEDDLTAEHLIIIIVIDPVVAAAEAGPVGMSQINADIASPGVASIEEAHAFEDVASTHFFLCIELLSERVIIICIGRQVVTGGRAAANLDDVRARAATSGCCRGNRPKRGPAIVIAVNPGVCVFDKFGAAI